ncbi:bifunctional tRNA pseudouridine(32) synthase/23S rRNA pseudouridine(746) synthase RluA [Catenovulum sp. 2E275]|uniref:bifunctional tRNA pseudouridine(32) synthase/23S rRNA pseudouridine(746) synthase RluA n=1 Tax=Catenovulum sp. 2E275 TaxID=2980497 RepID=UPI0021CF650B|nr:bifunctional tRNA pseudouridine(32) synthase/23S rRNA pseudouridine(746) synthase RluA [Catenovulum sp. 2E275]MCU4677431.1 bifunctional tRNA pseudouridine(32) synthase/23S rRNA pseudouridine(746) synthase RluA [Catenovulum sp. 2E275]
MSFVYNPPKEPVLPIIYHDKDIVVFNKPSGLLSVRGKLPEHQDSLEARAQRVWPKIGIVHRLDMATSGIMVWALHKAAHSNLARQFQERQTSKHYIARVYGHPIAEQGLIELPLICDWPNRPKQMVEHNVGKKSATFWQVIGKDTESSRILLHPITGRSHQLRVHMLALGHPILGDRLYAHPQALALAPRLQLHAERLQFSHPISGENLEFYAACPF